MKIRLMRVKINSMNEKIHSDVIKLLCNDSPDRHAKGTFIEDLDFTKPLLCVICPLAFFTGVLYHHTTDEPIVRLNSE